MDTQPTRKEVTHERIVETAARAIRRGGFRGVGVADIMKEAGLTHGGFYAHFTSRDALLAEALERAGRDSVERITKAIDASHAAGTAPLKALIDGYLSESHLRGCESGCPVAALASEMPRQAPEVRAAAAQRVGGLVALVGTALPERAAADAAIAIASQLLGALQLARALGDNAKGKNFLAAARRSLLAQFNITSTAHTKPSP
jgi:AcrR family transcriptional regulator